MNINVHVSRSPQAPVLDLPARGWDALVPASVHYYNDAMKVFVAVLDEGSLAGAGRKLGRSPAAVRRALAFLEGHVGVQLLHRTTRSSKLSEAGERYAAACRRVLTDLEEADILAAGEISPARHSYPDGASPQRRGGVAS